MGVGRRWRNRATALEAMTLLVVGRMLVGRIPLAYWRRSLGERVDPEPLRTENWLAENQRARHLAGVVERVAERLPGETRCLVRAMALQWLLRRRGLGAVLHIGVLQGQSRGTLHDLHAWVARRGEVLIGATDLAHFSLYSAATHDAS